jgi:hypothetical protein
MPNAVSQAVIDRAIRAAVARGLTVSGIELQPDGTVRILTGGAFQTVPDDPLAAWEAKYGNGGSAKRANTK